MKTKRGDTMAIVTLDDRTGRMDVTIFAETFNDNLVNSASDRCTRFADDDDSGENRFVASANINIPIAGEQVKTDVKVDYLGGSFENDYFGLEKINYGYFQVGIAPYYQIKEDDLTVNLGFSAYYLNDTEASENKFFIYPKMPFLNTYLSYFLKPLCNTEFRKWKFHFRKWFWHLISGIPEFRNSDLHL